MMQVPRVRRLQGETSNGTHCEDQAAEEEEGEEAHDEDALYFLFSAIIIGTLITYVRTWPRFRWIQETVVVFITGMLYEVILHYSNLYDNTNGLIGASNQMWMQISPHLLLAVMLPVLLTGDALTIDTEVARRVAKQCLYLAGPGVLISSFTTALFLWVYLPYNWSFKLCMTMASILAATDPVAVVSLLKELGAAPSLTVQIQGEALLNDGTAIVLFNVAYSMLEGQSTDYSGIMIDLMKSAVCAVLIGFILGSFFVYWIRAANNRLDDRSSLIQITITLCCAYWSFILAERTFKVSGVLCTVTSALVLADKMWPSIVSHEAMHHVWHTFEHLGNSVIFFVAGALVGNSMTQMSWKDYGHVLVIYVVCVLVRGGMVYASIPILNLLGHSTTEPVTMADAAIMTWGGLRGAVGLALAIEVKVGRADGMIEEKEGQRVLFYVGFIALMTLLLNATTSPALLKWLRLNRPSGAKKMVMQNLHQQMNDFADYEEDAAFTQDHRHRGEHGGGPASKTPASKTSLTSNKGTVRSSIKEVLVEVEHCIMESHTQELTEKRTYQEPRCQGLACCVGCGISLCPGWRGDLFPETELKIPASKFLLRALKDARVEYLAIPLETLDMLGLPNLDHLIDRESQMEHVLMNSDVCSVELKPVNDIFIQLVRAKYIKEMRAGHLVEEEEECLQHSISAALMFASYELADVGCLRSKVLATYVDEEIQSAVNREQHISGKQTVDATNVLMRNCSNVGETKLQRQSPPAAVATRFNTVQFNWVMVLVIAASSSISFWIAFKDANELGETSEFDTFEQAVMIIFFSVFVLETLCKLALYRRAFCDSYWNLLDLLLSMFCLLGLLLQWPIRTTEILGADTNELIRMFMVLQVLRMFRISSLLSKIHVLRNYTLFSASPRLASHLQTIRIFTTAVKAHATSQEELLRFFGRHGRVESCAVARCMVESMTQAYRAGILASQLANGVPPEVLLNLRTINEVVESSEEICCLVEEALHSGAVGEGDAESLLDPLKSHMHFFSKIIKHAHRGILDKTLTEEVDPMETKARARRMHSRTSTFSDSPKTVSPKSIHSGPPHCVGKQFSEAHSEKNHSPRWEDWIHKHIMPELSRSDSQMYPLRAIGMQKATQTEPEQNNHNHSGLEQNNHHHSGGSPVGHAAGHAAGHAGLNWAVGDDDDPPLPLFPPLAPSAPKHGLQQR